MKLTDHALTVLKNFSTINNSLLIKKGNKQSTMADGKNAIAEAVLEDDFPREFGIYELSKFLGIITSLKSPDLNFEDDYVLITDSDGVKISYHYCAPNLITVPPEKGFSLVEDHKLFLTEKNRSKLIKLASTLGVGYFYVRGSGGKIVVGVDDRHNDSTNNAEIEITDEYDGDDFRSDFTLENIAYLLPGDYHVVLDNRGLSYFETEDKTLNYYIALQK